MKAFRVFGISAVLAAFSFVPLAANADTSPPLKRVSLSSAGVGYFEHEAQIDGPTTLTLTVPRDQIDDVLKSLVVTGSAGSAVSVRMPGSEPLSRSFRDFPFTPAGLTSPHQLLNELRGAEISIEGSRKIQGKLMSAQPEVTTLGDGKTTTVQYRISVMTQAGLQQAILQDIQSLRFEDEKLRDQMSRALELVASAQENGPRLLDITLSGEGKRTVRIGYVVSTPVWKVTYRVRLDKNDKAHLQGWAILENTSGRDWDNVSLTLLSGNPVTFRQPLYQAYYIDRPVVPVEIPNRMLPMVDKGELNQQPRQQLAKPAVPASPIVSNASNRAAQWDARSKESMNMVTASGPAGSEYAAEAPPPPAAEMSESQTQIVFTLPEAQTIASGQSMMVPIISQEIPAIRHTLLEGVKPVVAVEIANNTSTGLPPGAITFFDDTGSSSYLGDGQIGALPAGEKRLVGFAADLNVRIMRDPTVSTTQHSASIADNIIHVKNKTRQTTTFRMKSSAPEKRIVVIDIPRNPGETLVEPKEGSENVTLILNGYRIRHTLEAGKEETLNIVTESTGMETIGFDALQRLDRDSMDSYEVWFTQNGAIDELTKKIFREIADIRKDAVEADEAIASLQEERETIVSEQERLRQNLARVPSGSDLQKRYLKQMTQQEDRMEEILRQIDTEKARKAKSDAALRAYLSRMSK